MFTSVPIAILVIVVVATVSFIYRTHWKHPAIKRLSPVTTIVAAVDDVMLKSPALVTRFFSVATGIISVTLELLVNVSSGWLSPNIDWYRAALDNLTLYETQSSPRIWVPAAVNGIPSVAT